MEQKKSREPTGMERSKKFLEKGKDLANSLIFEWEAGKMGKKLNGSKEAEAISKQILESAGVEKEKPKEAGIRERELMKLGMERMKGLMEGQVKTLEQKVKELESKEFTIGNFISSENALGLSTMLTGGETFTGARLKTLKAALADAKSNLDGLSKIPPLLEAGSEKPGPETVKFLASPEGKFLIESVHAETRANAEGNYHLNKARYLSGLGFGGEVFAQPYFEKLKGTPLEGVANKEWMGKWEQFRQGGLTDFANTFLSLDSLAIMATGTGVASAGGNILRSALGKVVEKSAVMGNVGAKLEGGITRAWEAIAGRNRIGRKVVDMAGGADAIASNATKAATEKAVKAANDAAVHTGIQSGSQYLNGYAA